METSATLALQWVSRWLLRLAIFLTPLFFLPITPDKLELHKYFLLYACVLLSLLCWLGRAVMLKNLAIQRTPLDTTLAGLWVLFLVISFFSQDRYLSFFGDFSQLGLSFVGVSVFIIFYFLVVQYTTDIAEALKSVYALLAAGALSAAYFIVTILKIITPPPSLLPGINVVHGSNIIFGTWLAIMVLWSLAFLIMKHSSVTRDLLMVAVLLLSGTAVVLLGFKLVWIAVAIGLCLLLVSFLSYADEIRRGWLSVTFALFIAALLFIFLDFNQFFTVSLPVEVTLSQGSSWAIAKSTLTAGMKNFLLGTGPATFSYDFSRYRPEFMNTNFAWDVRFGQAASIALEWITVHGALVSLSFTVLILLTLGTIGAVWLNQLRELRERRSFLSDLQTWQGSATSPLFFWGLAASWVTVTVVAGLTHFGASHWVLWWLLLALLMCVGAFVSRVPLAKSTFSLKMAPQYVMLISFGFILLFTVMLVLGIYLGRFYEAEILYSRSLSEPPEVKIGTLERAIALNSHRPIFQLALADTFLSQAAAVAGRGNDPGQVYQFVAVAVGAAKQATDIAPNNVATWEFLSTMYANARAVAPEANSWLVTSLDRAVELEPTNPLFYVGLGNAKLVAKQYEAAVKDFEKAIELKPDYLLGYVRLALAKESQGNLDGAIATMEKGLPHGLQNAEYLFQTGRLYFNRHKQNDYPLAELAFRRALGINQNYSDALYGLALLYEATNHRPEAGQLFRRVLELNPGNKEVQQHITALAPVPAAPAQTESAVPIPPAPILPKAKKR